MSTIQPFTQDFSSRENLAAIFNARGLNGVGVECGVQRGVNAARICSQWRGKLFYPVDPWAPYAGVVDTKEMHEGYMNEAIQSLAGTGQEFETLRMKSVVAATLVKQRIESLVHDKLDWVYLDDDHFYEALRDGIEAWWPLLKSGGILAGHDYVPDGWHRNGDAINAYPTAEEAGVGPGHCGPFEVVKAVNEYFGPGGKLTGETVDGLHLTSEQTDGGWRSWLVVKA